MKDAENQKVLVESMKNFFMLPNDAIEWLLMLWQAIQLFDDVADNDEIKREDLDKVIWNTLVAMPENDFYKRHCSVLAPIVASMILKWQASDQAEKTGNADEKSFVWRAGYYDVLLICIQLCHGTENAIKASFHVMNMYGEKFKDYLKEFDHA